MGKLSGDQISTMAELRERGWSYGRLATKFNVSPGAIHYQCLRQGAVSPNSQPRKSTGPAVVHLANGRVQRRFTAREDAAMVAMSVEGQSVSAISKAMKRPITSVRIRLMTLAMRDEGYSAVDGPAEPQPRATPPSPPSKPTPPVIPPRTPEDGRRPSTPEDGQPVTTR